MNPPVAEKRPVNINQHGTTRTDEYAWLRDDNWQKFIQGDLDFADPAVKKYLEAEADYTKSQMQGTEELQATLYQEMLGRLKEDDESYPFKKNDFYYFSRTLKGKDYPQYVRRKGSVDGPDEIYFDVNKEAEGKALFIMGGSAPNEANTLYAYCFNLTGSMERTLKVRDLTTGKDFEWEVENTTGVFLWVNDEEIAYIERGPQSRGQKVYQFSARQGPKSRKLMFDKPKQLDNMFMGIGHTTDRRWQIIQLNSGATSEVYVKPNDADQFQHFMRGENDVSYTIDHKNGEFFVLTNEGEHPNGQVYTCATENLKRENWKLMIEESSTLSIEDIHVYGEYFIVERKNNELARSEIAIIHLPTQQEQLVQMQDPAYTLSFFGANDPNSPTVRLGYESSIQPGQSLELELATAKWRVLKSKEVPTYDPNQYELLREFATARDGAKIPLTIVQKKGFVRDGSAPAFVYAYGSYGIGMPSFFSSAAISLVDRGFVFVVAHIRGGDEKGLQWYLDGKMFKKLNTFYDYIDSCEFLVQQKLTSRGKIAANGGSAGGLLMGAVTNMRPDLFRCVIAQVPFVDVINTISDSTLPLTPPEWEEWGNPIESKESFDYMMSYSPYDNVEAKDYPAMLYNSGISDEQVTYWEPAKMVARLRDRKTDNNLLLLHIKMHAGHAGASKRYESLKDKAFDYAFVLKSFGLG